MNKHDWSNCSLSTLKFIDSFGFVAGKERSWVTRNSSTNYHNVFIPLFSTISIGDISKFRVLFLCSSRSMRLRYFTVSFYIASARYALCILADLWFPLFNNSSTSFILLSSSNSTVGKSHPFWRRSFNNYHLGWLLKKIIFFTKLNYDP